MFILKLYNLKLKMIHADFCMSVSKNKKTVITITVGHHRKERLYMFCQSGLHF